MFNYRVPAGRKYKDRRGRLPRSVGAKDGVEDDEELAQAGGESGLGMLGALVKAGIEVLITGLARMPATAAM